MCAVGAINLAPSADKGFTGCNETTIPFDNLAIGGNHNDTGIESVIIATPVRALENASLDTIICAGEFLYFTKNDSLINGFNWLNLQSAMNETISSSVTVSLPRKSVSRTIFLESLIS